MIETNNSEESKQEKKLRPSYASIGQAEAALEIFRRMNPKQIDINFIVTNNLATRPNSPRILDFYRWLKIIDFSGAVNSESASKLRMVGTERDNFVVTAIKEGYKDLFEEVNVENATKDDFTNFFIRKYDYTQLTASFAAALFINLCQKYNIPVSDAVKSKTPSLADKEIASKRRQDKMPKQRKKDYSDAIGGEQSSPPIDVGSNQYMISIKGKDRSYVFPVNVSDDMEEVEAILNIIKKKLPKS